jgi:prepilin-type processing-associated H-X9-DG protein
VIAGIVGDSYWSQHARLLPYLEQQTVYNAINWSFGARWSDGDSVYTDTNPPDHAAGGNDSIPQMTVLVTQIQTFLCPSDGNPGSSGMFIVNGQSKLVGACNYPANIGLNRRIDSCNGVPDNGTWKINGPNYIGTNWDTTSMRQIGLRDFLDGTSNTVSFSEWIKGPATGPPGAPNGLGVNYKLNLPSDAFPTDFQFAQACNSVPVTGANQTWTWKGEWWAYGGMMIYSHTQMPNRTSCDYSDVGQDGRGTITMAAASSNHPGGVNMLFMDGSVRFVKSSVSPQAYYAIATINKGEIVSSDQF